MTTNETKDLGKTDTGIQPNVAALLSYVLGFVSGVIFLLIEKNPFVRFHAIQSIVVFGAIFVAHWVLMLIPVLGVLLGGLLSLLAVVVWVILMVKAYQGERYKLPVAGEIVEKYC